MTDHDTHIADANDKVTIPSHRMTDECCPGNANMFDPQVIHNYNQEYQTYHTTKAMKTR